MGVDLHVHRPPGALRHPLRPGDGVVVAVPAYTSAGELACSSWHLGQAVRVPGNRIDILEGAVFARIGVGLVALCLVMTGARGVAARSSRWQERTAWAAEFERLGVTGTALVFDEAEDRFLFHDRQRVKTGFIPASTFKILNALVALENGNVTDEFEVIRWDGVDRGLPEWNRDHSLASGMRFSAVWFYQEMARRTGAERMQAWVDRVGYGNGDIGGGIDQFWLTGALRISAREQVGFLRRLADGTLPFRADHQEATRRILLSEDAPDYDLYAKTGWTTRPGQPDIGWYIGWVERHGRRCFFALNIDMPSPQDAPKRPVLARRLLADAGALPASGRQDPR
jgi:beta-lactamase class D